MGAKEEKGNDGEGTRNAVSNTKFVRADHRVAVHTCDRRGK